MYLIAIVIVLLFGRRGGEVDAYETRLNTHNVLLCDVKSKLVNVANELVFRS